MSKHQRPRLSLRGDHNAHPTAHIEQAPVETNEPTQERPMEAPQENNPAPEAEAPPATPPEVIEPTAKELAAAEETNNARRIALAKQRQEDAEKGEIASQSTLSAAAKGREALQQAFQAQKERSVKPAYVPPPRTERQMSALEEELAAGRRAQQRAQAQFDNRPQPKPAHNEGFTTTVHRPNDVVPDPTIPAKGGSVAGTRLYGADAP